jgi:hypothetical protein
MSSPLSTRNLNGDHPQSEWTPPVISMVTTRNLNGSMAQPEWLNGGTSMADSHSDYGVVRSSVRSSVGFFSASAHHVLQGDMHLVATCGRELAPASQRTSQRLCCYET